jgi:glutamate-1-semialdehyde 2,1-aminomutase/spore coat polysaccharide biosynthesis protein SpsF
MAEMEEIFFSATFGGEALSLAAAIAVVDKLRREPVIEGLWRKGAALADAVGALIEGNGLAGTMALRGKAPWMIIDFADHAGDRKEAIRTLFIREMIKRRVLVTNSHNLCHAHDDDDLALVVAAYEGVLPVIRDELDRGDLESRLQGPVIKPIFKVR